MKIEIDITSVLIGFALGSAPFWLMASDLKDMSELKSSGIGIGGLISLKLVESLFQKKDVIKD